jgi:hypothetical protein
MAARKEHSYRTERIIEAARELTSAQVDATSQILGRRYASITVLAHRYMLSGLKRSVAGDLHKLRCDRSSETTFRPCPALVGGLTRDASDR